MSEACPVCGWTKGCDRNHIPCVLKMREEAMLMKERYQDAEAELADCAKTCGGLEYRLEQAGAELAAQKALLSVVPTARGGKS